MTDTNELRKLLEKATPLPWREVVTRYERPGECIESASLDDVGCPTRVVDASSSGMEGGGFVRGEDLRLVVAATNALPAMLDELDAKNEEVQRLNGVIGDSGAWAIQAVQEMDALRAEVEQRLNGVIGDSGAWAIQAVQEMDALRAEVERLRADLREAMELLRAHGEAPTRLRWKDIEEWNTRYGKLLAKHKETP